MSFWDSPLVKGIENGDLPVLEVEADVKIDNESLLQIGIILFVCVVSAVLIFKLVNK